MIPMPPVDHPSFLDLDLVALGVADRETVAHVEACPRCAAHVALIAADGAASVPAWVGDLARPRRKHNRWLAAAAGALALAAAAVAFVAPRPMDEHHAPFAEKGPRGDASVVVYLRRDGEVRPLGPGEPLRAGDALRLGVRAPGYARVTVRDGPRPDASVLYRGPLPAGPDGLLPVSWSVDGESNSETLDLELTPRDRRAAPWRATLTFPKDR
jgi:hypothetical protein